MELIITFGLALAALWLFRAAQQKQRIALLASFLSRYNIEKNIETVTQGYLRAFGEADAGRRDQVLGLLGPNEQELCRQVTQLAADFAVTDDAARRVSKLPVWVPFATTVAGSFDMRAVLGVHARGIARAVEPEAAAPARDRAFTISAELFLLQHTCHWFCRSKLVASARMLARHKTSYDQLLAAVLPQTRAEYLALLAAGRDG